MTLFDSDDGRISDHTFARAHTGFCRGCGAREDLHDIVPVRFDAELSRAAGQEGQARADAHAEPEWKDLADAAIERVAKLMPKFTADDVWAYGDLPPTSENRALGPRMNAAARRGIIAATNEYTSTRQVKLHGSPRRFWRSLINP